MLPSNGSRTARILGGMVTTLLLLLAPTLQAQETGTVTGRVTDAQSGEPIPSVQVFIAGLDVGVLTQQNGRFLLQNIPAGTHTISAERIGFRSTTAEVSVDVGETVVQNFTLSEEALRLDEVIVTGTPGGTQRRAIGNSVATVEASEVTQQVAVNNMQDLLSARTPGLNFERLAGNVGTGSQIQIRGVGSFNLSSQPLIYVDGVRVNNSTRAGPTLAEDEGTFSDDTGDGQVSVLDDFNPEDIESIEIIKGPAAATLYGTEASAGVIQIITKRGAEGDAQFSLSVRQGMNFMVDPAGKLGDMYSCRDSFSPPCDESTGLFRYNMYDEANDYISGKVPGPDGGQYFDWPTDNLFQYGHSQNYNLDVRGGTQTIRYFLSGNYKSEEGIAWYNTDEAFRLRANIGVVFSDNWTLDVSTGYVDGYTRFANPVISDGGLWQDLRWSNGFCLLRINPDECPRLGGFQEHLPSDVADIEATRDYSRFTGSATLNFTYGDWLSQRAIVGLDKGWDVNRNLFPLDPVEPVYSETLDGQITFAKPVTTNLSLDYSATATVATDEFSFATSVGAQYYEEEFEQFENTGLGLPSPLSTTINQTPPARANLVYDFVENKSLGIYVQEEVGWNERVFVTAAVRADDNSAFGANFDLEYYPKVSATWVISEEGFWNVDAVNSLRLRSAWGKAGRQPNAFAGQDIFAVIPAPGGTAAVRPESPGNPDVGPETSTEIEAGFDIALLDDRISGEFTYFTQQNEDALVGIEIPWSMGFPGVVDQNLGRLDSWGWEALLNARLYVGDGWSLELGLGGDHVDNEIKSLGSFTGNRGTGIVVGLPFPSEDVEQFVTSAEYDPNGTFTDANGQTISAVCDQGRSLAPEGAENPSQYGLVLGGELGPCASQRDIFIGPHFYTYTWSVAPRLTLLDNTLQIYALAEGAYGKMGDEAAAQWGHIYNNSRVSRTEDDPLWVVKHAVDDGFSESKYDADFWKLRELGARYTLPESLVARAGADRASLSLTARNFWTIWVAQEEIYGVPVADPEFNAPGGFGGATDGSNVHIQPPTASVSATLRVSF